MRDPSLAVRSAWDLVGPCEEKCGVSCRTGYVATFYAPDAVARAEIFIGAMVAYHGEQTKGPK